MHNISAILMAAGFSKRMGKDKLLLPYNRKSLLQHSVDLLSALPVSEKILITIKARLEHILLPPCICAVINENPHLGQSESLKLGIKTATGEAYLFLNADQPLLTANDIIPLLDAYADNSAGIIYPVIDGNPCSPTLFPSSFRNELLTLTGDTGGRAIREKHPHSCIPIEPNRKQNFLDIDDEKEYNGLGFRENSPLGRGGTAGDGVVLRGEAEQRFPPQGKFPP